MELDSLRRKITITLITIGFGFPLAIFFFLNYFFLKSYAKADIRVDVEKVVSPLYHNWQSLGQGGEEVGVRMLQSVVPQVKELNPQYIRIDHIYDFYNVVSRDDRGGLAFDWSQLDQTVCDIYETGAKPFLVLGYMPPAISSDGTPIGQPNNWTEWSTVVQETVERYSSSTSSVCPGPATQQSGLYYEVWNEPDLESFGKWGLSGAKNYKTLYYHSSIGVQKAKDVYPFSIGGPATTAPYKNWVKNFLAYVIENNLRIDFLSWHRYTDDPNVFADDVKNVNEWLSDEALDRYKNLPKVISEWGFDSEYTPVAETNVGAAYTIASIRNIIDSKVTMAFTFEIKDGQSPSHGILTNSGDKKTRFEALKLLNSLEGHRVQVHGEGDFVRAVASRTNAVFSLLLVNYDKENKNRETVPFTFANLPDGSYTLTIKNVEGTFIEQEGLKVSNGVLKRTVFLAPNRITLIQLKLEQ